MRIILYTTSAYDNARIILSSASSVYLDEKVSVSPLKSYTAIVDCKGETLSNLDLKVTDAHGHILVAYKADKPEIKPVPDPARAAKAPKEISSMEQLFLTGQHLEQYRHATYSPMDYYMEALSREESDIR